MIARFTRISLLAFGAIFLCSKLSFAGELPQGCFQLKRSDNTYTSENPDNYKYVDEIRKSDIMCLGKSINIDKSIKTSGGDLFIYADEITINAPIDTREYYPISHFYWSQTGSDNENNWFHEDQRAEISRDEQYIASYNSYYTHCVDCYTLADVTYAPRLPDGLVPRDVSGAGSNNYPPRRDGISPPSFADKQQVSPGSVWIFATHIKINPALTATSTFEEKNCPSSFAERSGRYAIEAGGLYGGRGGAGSPSVCVNRAGGGFDCVDELYDATGISGSGGNGGPGGAVSIQLIGTTVDHHEELDQLLSNVDVSGGPGGPAGGFFSPRQSHGHGNEASGGYCDFYRYPSSQASSKGQDGVDGTKSIGTLTPAEAIRIFLSLVSGHDGRPGYEYPDLASSDLGSLFDNGVTFTDNANSLLDEIVTGAQMGAVESAISLIYENKIPNAGSLPTAFSIKGSEVDYISPQNDTNFLILRELAKFSGSRENYLSQYLGESSGAFNVAIPQVYQTYLSESARLDQSLNSVDNADIKNSLAHIDESTMNTLFLYRQEQLNDEVNALGAAIAAAQKANDQNSSELAGKIAGSLADIGSSAIALYGAIDTGAYPVAIGAAGKLAGGVNNLITLLSDHRLDTVPALKQKLLDVQLALGRLSVELGAQKQRVTGLLLSSGQSQVARRVTTNLRREARTFLFDDMFKATLISYFSDPARSPGEFKLNSIGLLTWLSDQFPSSEPYFRLRDIADRACERQSATAIDAKTCLALPPSNSRRVVHALLHYGGNDIQIPIYVVNPTSRAFVLPTYGLPIEVDDITAYHSFTLSSNFNSGK